MWIIVYLHGRNCCFHECMRSFRPLYTRDFTLSRFTPLFDWFILRLFQLMIQYVQFTFCMYTIFFIKKWNIKDWSYKYYEELCNNSFILIDINQIFKDLYKIVMLFDASYKYFQEIQSEILLKN